MIRGFKAMSTYLENHAGVIMHQDTLRKATRDPSNPLPVEWDNGFATIKPTDLMRWREKRRGRCRANRAAGSIR